MRSALAAVLALTAAPNGFTVTGFAEQVRVMTGQNTSEYSTRHASYDLRKIRGEHLVEKPGRGRRYHVPPDAARTIATLLALRDQVIAPIVAGVRSPRMGRKPITWTRSTATTKPSGSTCKPSSHTSASRQPKQQRHRQHVVDQNLAGF